MTDTLDGPIVREKMEVGNTATPFSILDDQDGYIQTTEPTPISSEPEQVERIVDIPVPSRVEEVDGNVQLMAEYWKSTGYLNSDIKISEIKNHEDLERAYRDSHQERLLSEVKDAAISELRDLGYTEDILEVARLLKQGISPDNIQHTNLYEYFSSLEASGDSDEDVQAREELLSAYYAHKDEDLSNEELKEKVEEDFDRGRDIERYRKAKEFFSKKAQDQKSQMSKDAETARKTAEKAAERQINDLKSYIKKGEVAGSKYSTEQMRKVEKALFENTEYVEIEGKKMRINLYQRMRMEFRKNPEAQVKAMFDFILGEDIKVRAEEEANGKVKAEILRGLRPQNVRVIAEQNSNNHGGIIKTPYLGR